MTQTDTCAKRERFSVYTSFYSFIYFKVNGFSLSVEGLVNQEDPEAYLRSSTCTRGQQISTQAHTVYKAHHTLGLTLTLVCGFFFRHYGASCQWDQIGSVQLQGQV